MHSHACTLSFSLLSRPPLVGSTSMIHVPSPSLQTWSSVPMLTYSSTAALTNNYISAAPTQTPPPPCLLQLCQQDQLARPRSMRHPHTQPRVAVSRVNSDLSRPCPPSPCCGALPLSLPTRVDHNSYTHTNLHHSHRHRPHNYRHLSRSPSVPCPPRT